jgi:hypothetical protein
MSRNSLLDRVFYGAVLGVYLVVDSVKNQGFGFSSSFRVLMLAVVTILGFLAVLRRNRENRGDDEETQAEEL